MPRPNKPINPGPLTQPVSASRGSTWAKHAGPEHSDQYEPDGLILVDAMTHETVTEIDVRDDVPVVTVSEDVEITLVEPLTPTVTYVWESSRTIEGRTYRRFDELVPAGSGE